MYFTCTSGGAGRCGQIIHMRPGVGEDPCRVALFLESSVEFAVAVHAVLRLGAVFMPVSALTKADKLTRARHRMHCDHAFYVGGTHENAAFLGELERLPAAETPAQRSKLGALQFIAKISGSGFHACHGSIGVAPHACR